jgi:hypothetical protein
MSVSLAEITATEDVGVMRPPINLHWDKVAAQVRRKSWLSRLIIAHAKRSQELEIIFSPLLPCFSLKNHLDTHLQKSMPTIKS